MHFFLNNFKKQIYEKIKKKFIKNCIKIKNRKINQNKKVNNYK